MKQIKLFPALLVALVIGSCTPSFDNPKYNPGSADFTSYVALGNSLTAGYSDGALYAEGQLNSYPAMLAAQFALVGGNQVFRIPLIDDANAVNGVSPAPISTALLRTTSKFVLGFSTGCDSVTSLGPVPSAPANNDNVSFFQSVYQAGSPFNNLGVPGIKSFHLDNPQVSLLSTTNPDYNPFYARFASITATSTILGDAQLVNPTFFTLWIGSNDVFSYALNGGVSPNQSGVSPGDITPLDTFKVALKNAVAKLIATGATGAIGNIPDVTDIPFFTTVPYNALNLTRQGQVDTLNAAYSALNITFQLGPNPFIVEDATAPGGLRKILATEFICMTIPQNEIKCAGLGSMVPIPDKYWLDQAEIDLIKGATSSFNDYIKAVADTVTNVNKLAFVDFNSYFKTFTKGVIFNGVSYTAEFVSGGAFSLDGVHPNQRGYALIANQFIRSINAKFGSTIPEVDVNRFKGVIFP